MDFDRLVEAKLKEAREKGEFDNLKRQGAVEIDEELNIPEDERLAMMVLKRNDVSPQWIEADKALRMRIDTARRSLRRSWEWRRAKLLDAPSADERERIDKQWARAKDRFGEELVAINKEIFQFNLKTPAASVQRIPLRIEEELQRATRPPAE